MRELKALEARAEAAETPGMKRTSGIVTVVAVILSIAMGALMYVTPDPLVIGGYGFVMLLALMAIRIPVGIALAVVGALGMYMTSGMDAAQNMMRATPWSSTATWTLSVIPMFVLMGMLMERSGLGADIFTAVRAMVGRTPAGLAISTNFAGAAMGAASGSTLGIVYALGRSGIPAMVKAGYDPRFAVASVLMAGTGGQLIPPSILLVVYAGMAQVPVGKQLIAGVLPGVLIHVAFAVMMLFLVLMKPSLAPRGPVEKLGASVRARRILGLWPVAVLVTVVLGGLYGGFFTATEAGAFGALAACIMIVAVKGVGRLRTSVWPSMRDTIVSTSSIFLIIIGGTMFGRFMTLTGIPRAFSQWLEAIGAGAVTFMLLVLVLYLVLGTFMDPVPMMLITVPILLPVAAAVGVDPLLFGVFAVLLGELAVLTPPVGVLLYVGHKIALESGVKISIGRVIQGVMWFYPVTIVFAILLILFPDFFLALPNAMSVAN